LLWGKCALRLAAAFVGKACGCGGQSDNHLQLLLLIQLHYDFHGLRIWESGQAIAQGEQQLVASNKRARVKQPCHRVCCALGLRTSSDASAVCSHRNNTRGKVAIIIKAKSTLRGLRDTTSRRATRALRGEPALGLSHFPPNPRDREAASNSADQRTRHQRTTARTGSFIGLSSFETATFHSCDFAPVRLAPSALYCRLNPVCQSQTLVRHQPITTLQRTADTIVSQEIHHGF
jgi:hypothetical protein